MQEKRPLAKYVLSLTIFGMNGIVASYITLGSLQTVFMRTFIGSLFLALLMLVTRTRTSLFDNLKHTLYLMVSGIALGISWIFLFEAYRLIGVGTASLLYYCGPMIVMVLAPLLFHEKLTYTKTAGFIIVVIGMLCINGQALQQGKSAWGLFCGLMSAIFYAGMVIFSKKAESITGISNALGQLTTAFFTVAAFALIKGELAFQLHPNDVLPLLILGLVNTGVGCFFYFSSISKLPVQTVAICGYLEPLSAVLFSILFLNERMTAYQILGAVLILGGAAFSQMLPLQKKVDTISAS